VNSAVNAAATTALGIMASWLTPRVDGDQVVYFAEIVDAARPKSDQSP